jgi:hypothetical protein
MGEQPVTVATGTRVTLQFEGAQRSGVVTDVTYTPKKGNVAFAVSLDEPVGDGRDVVAVAREDFEVTE